MPRPVHERSRGFDDARRPPGARLGALLRWPWLVPGAWLVGVTAAALVVYMPAAEGPPGVLVGVVSLVLAVVLVASVVAVAAGLGVGMARRVGACATALAARREARTRGRTS